MRSILPLAGAIALAMTSAASAAQPVTLPSGLSYTDEVVGTGPEPKTGQQVTVHYTGWLDKDGGKLTLKHGDIKSLDMPAMTMVFVVKDKAMLDKLKAGDKIKFKAINDAGKFTVTEMQMAQ